ncbi:MAG TPA: FAD-binding oxidoreductase [Planctomycetota bacterium]|nr:FAD-binding oxidoreductase [Planctomycetota bacterium]
MNRREFFGATAALALGSSVCGSPQRARRAPDPCGTILNDVHSKLNATRVERVVPVDSLDSLRAAILEARRRGRSISIAGGRHAMGGQQFGEGAVHLDTRPLRRILSFDLERGIVEVEAGIQWPELIEGCLRAQPAEKRWGIAQKQTGADRLSLGGALAANVHGRGLALPPLIGEIESVTLLDARGELRSCSREADGELFGLAIGGYGLFGAVYSLRLKLAPRRKLERVVEVRGSEGLAGAFEQRIREGCLYGDFQFETDETSRTFLTRGVFSCYRPVDPSTPIPPAQRELSKEDWLELLYLAHADKARAFEAYASHYLATHGQLYWSDLQHLGYYPDDYHALLDRRLGSARATEMISELYVHRPALAGFLQAAAESLRELRAGVIYGTVRLIERDRDSFLAWAREPWACVVLNLHVEHSPEGIERARRAFRSLIDLARERGGSYYLTYHRWATREQVEACHPRMAEFLRKKLAHDPEERFQSEWWRHHRALFADVL